MQRIWAKMLPKSLKKIWVGYCRQVHVRRFGNRYGPIGSIWPVRFDKLSDRKALTMESVLP